MGPASELLSLVLQSLMTVAQKAESLDCDSLTKLSVFEAAQLQSAAQHLPGCRTHWWLPQLGSHIGCPSVPAMLEPTLTSWQTIIYAFRHC